MIRFLSTLEIQFLFFKNEFRQGTYTPLWGVSIVVFFLFAGCAQQHFVGGQRSGVTLYLEAPDATEVLFASSADSFRLHPATKSHEGLWMTDTLADREFRYFYVVDGGVYVPDCQYRERDDFGTTNCIYQP